MSKAAFKVGFLTKLAEHGIRPAEYEAMLKIAEVLKTADLGQGILDNATTLLILGMGLPVASGALTGWAHAKLTNKPKGNLNRILLGQRTNYMREQSRKLQREIGRLKLKNGIMQDKEEEVTSL